MKELIKKIPVVGALASKAYQAYKKRKPFPGAAIYWEQRYDRGGNSGAGSYGRLAEFKAEILNDFVSRHAIGSVIEFGCGDGHQLTLARYPAYEGFDVSASAVMRCKQAFVKDTTKKFWLMEDFAGQTAELTLSLDVIYHLTEDEVFHEYMERLFASATQYVIVYSSDSDDNRLYANTHMTQRKFTRWIATHAPAWRLLKHIPNRYPYEGDELTGSISDFYIWERVPVKA